MSVFMEVVWVRRCFDSLNRKSQNGPILGEPILGFFNDLRYENMINNLQEVRACFDFANMIGSNKVSAYVMYDVYDVRRQYSVTRTLMWDCQSCTCSRGLDTSLSMVQSRTSSTYY